MQLTQKQERVLSFIKTYRDSIGYPPSSRDIATELGVTQTAAMNHLRALRKKGRVKTTPGVPRSIVVL